LAAAAPALEGRLVLGWLRNLVRGTEGHPSHPPLTDATIGAFTVGVVAAVLGWLGIEEDGMAAVAFLAIVLGLVFSIPTIVTGFVDYLEISRGTPLWRTATLHWLAMVFAVATFLVAAALLHDGWSSGDVSGAGTIVAIAAEGLLTLGGWIGGTIVFVHGMRVLGRLDLPTRKAISPTGAHEEPERD
jgi:uncharacterized membrane protein